MANWRQNKYLKLDLSPWVSFESDSMQSRQIVVSRTTTCFPPHNNSYHQLADGNYEMITLACVGVQLQVRVKKEFVGIQIDTKNCNGFTWAGLLW